MLYEEKKDNCVFVSWEKSQSSWLWFRSIFFLIPQNPAAELSKLSDVRVRADVFCVSPKLYTKPKGRKELKDSRRRKQGKRGENTCLRPAAAPDLSLLTDDCSRGNCIWRLTSGKSCCKICSAVLSDTHRGWETTARLRGRERETGRQCQTMKMLSDCSGLKNICSKL